MTVTSPPRAVLSLPQRSEVRVRCHTKSAVSDCVSQVLQAATKVHVRSELAPNLKMRCAKKHRTVRLSGKKTAPPKTPHCALRLSDNCAHESTTHCAPVKKKLRQNHRTVRLSERKKRNSAKKALHCAVRLSDNCAPESTALCTFTKKITAPTGTAM